MNASISIERCQGKTECGDKFGYVHGDEDGYFFTWRDTLEETVASLEYDNAFETPKVSRETAAKFLGEAIKHDFPSNG